MSKARMYGMKSAYIPNAKADARYKKKYFEHGKAFADSDEEREKQRTKKTKCQGVVTNGENRID